MVFFLLSHSVCQARLQNNNKWSSQRLFFVQKICVSFIHIRLKLWRHNLHWFYKKNYHRGTASHTIIYTCKMFIVTMILLFDHLNEMNQLVRLSMFFFACHVNHDRFQRIEVLIKETNKNGLSLSSAIAAICWKILCHIFLLLLFHFSSVLFSFSFHTFKLIQYRVFFSIRLDVDAILSMQPDSFSHIAFAFQTI